MESWISKLSKPSNEIKKPPKTINRDMFMKTLKLALKERHNVYLKNGERPPYYIEINDSHKKTNTINCLNEEQEEYVLHVVTESSLLQHNHANQCWILYLDHSRLGLANVVTHIVFYETRFVQFDDLAITRFLKDRKSWNKLKRIRHEFVDIGEIEIYNFHDNVFHVTSFDWMSRALNEQAAIFNIDYCPFYGTANEQYPYFKVLKRVTAVIRQSFSGDIFRLAYIDKVAHVVNVHGVSVYTGTELTFNRKEVEFVRVFKLEDLRIKKKHMFDKVYIYARNSRYPECLTPEIQEIFSYISKNTVVILNESNYKKFKQ